MARLSLDVASWAAGMGTWFAATQAFACIAATENAAEKRGYCGTETMLKPIAGLASVPSSRTVIWRSRRR